MVREKRGRGCVRDGVLDFTDTEMLVCCGEENLEFSPCDGTVGRAVPLPEDIDTVAASTCCGQEIGFKRQGLSLIGGFLASLLLLVLRVGRSQHGQRLMIWLANWMV